MDQEAYQGDQELRLLDYQGCRKTGNQTEFKRTPFITLERTFYQEHVFKNEKIERRESHFQIFRLLREIFTW